MPSSPSLAPESAKIKPEASTPMPRPAAWRLVEKPDVVATRFRSTKCWNTKEAMRLLICIGKTKQSKEAKKAPDAAALDVGW